MEQSTLIRNKNYLNLDDSTNGEQNHQLNLSSFSNYQQDENHQDDGLEICRHVNVDTQTRLEYDNILDANNPDNNDEAQELNSEKRHAANDGQNNAEYNDDCNREEQNEYYGSHESNAYRNHLTPARHHADDDEGVNGEVKGDSVDSKRQLNLLRDSLAVEMCQNEQRRHNNSAVQQYLHQMQTEYLRLQRDLVEALELAHKIKAQKEAQIEAIRETVKDKDRLIAKLMANLVGLDETRLRGEFNALLVKQAQQTRMERQKMKNQIDIVEQQLVCERVTNSQTLQQFQMKLDDQKNSHEQKIELAREKLTNLELELNKVLSEPQNLVIRELKEEKSQLAGQVEELNLLLDENHAQYELMRERVEDLLKEQEQLERRGRDEIDRLHEQQVEQRKALDETRLELEDKHEVAQILQFNLQRSEKRVKNLLGVLRSKEATFKEMIGQLEIKHEQELEKAAKALRAAERKLIKCESQLDKKQNELVKLELEQENQLESIRNNRDQRIKKLVDDHQKAVSELQQAEIKLARQVEKELNCFRCCTAFLVLLITAHLHVCPHLIRDSQG